MGLSPLLRIEQAILQSSAVTFSCTDWRTSSVYTASTNELNGLLHVYTIDSENQVVFFTVQCYDANGLFLKIYFGTMLFRYIV